MRWMNKVLILYLSLVFIICGFLLFSKVEFSPEYTTPFTLSQSAIDYAETNHLGNNYIDPVIEFVSNQELALLSEGEVGIFTPLSVNPYLFERSWANYIIDYTQESDISVTVSLFNNEEGFYYIMAQVSMPLSEANEEEGLNLLMFGYSDEYEVSDTYSSFYYYVNKEYVEYYPNCSYDSDHKIFSLPYGNELQYFDNVLVVGYVFLELPVGNDQSFFECAVNVYDGTLASEDPGIILGFSQLVFADSDKYYNVSATWIKYWKENE